MQVHFFAKSHKRTYEVSQGFSNKDAKREMSQTPAAPIYVVIVDHLDHSQKAECIFFSLEKEEALEYGKNYIRNMRAKLDDWNCLTFLDNEEDGWCLSTQSLGVLWNGNIEPYTRVSIQRVTNGYEEKV